MYFSRQNPPLFDMRLTDMRLLCITFPPLRERYTIAADISLTVHIPQALPTPILLTPRKLVFELRCRERATQEAILVFEAVRLLSLHDLHGLVYLAPDLLPRQP
jgi:hypothetical protein